jgi:hypothetical protein
LDYFEGLISIYEQKRRRAVYTAPYTYAINLLVEERDKSYKYINKRIKKK